MNAVDELETPTVPARARTVLYAAGTLLGLGATPALLAAGYPVWSAVAGSLAGACNALAFGYRPTRPTAS